MTTQIVIKEITPLAENTTVTVAEGLNLVQRFNNLVDTPSNYIGQAGKYPRVNQTEDALEFDNADAETFKGKPQSHYLFGDNERGTQRWETGVDNITKSGPWYVTTNLTGLPLNVDGYVLHEQRDDTDDYSKQTYTPNNDNRTFTRIKVGGVYGEWNEAQTERWREYARGQAELEEMRRRNGDQFAASGFVHYGRHAQSGPSVIPINESLYAYININNVNTLRMGRTPTASTYEGTSKTLFPVTHIAGFVSELIGTNTNNDLAAGNFIKFTEAPNGTVIYDRSGNARGTGNANLNLLTDIDPKYGNTANGNVNEAGSRAFEGEVSNGDFRDSITNWSTTGSLTVANEVATLTITSGSLASAINNANPLAANTEYTLEMVVSNATSTTTVYNYCGSSTDVLGTIDVGETKTFTATFNTGSSPTRDIDVRITTAAGNSVDIHHVFVKKSSEEVVIDRHDMFGGEFFLEEVSTTNPFVYPKGMPQTQATTMNNITTTASNRPVTYYAVYDGDTGSKGRGVDFWAATDQQKIDMLSDESNNLFLLDDGRLAQWRMRQRTIAGAGNGNWLYIDSEGGDTSFAFEETISRVKPHGVKDLPDGGKSLNRVNAGGGNQDYLSRLSAAVTEKNTGVWCIRDQNSALSGEEGLCFFHVWGVVRRLNQGAYHPSFNPLGTARVWTADGTSSNVRFWYQDGSYEINSTASAFKYGTGFVNENSGKIGSTSGRDDERYYDGIYEGGDGGVDDYRLSAWDMSGKIEASKIFQKVISGTYRGTERITHTHINTSTETGIATGAVLQAQLPPNLEGGGTITIVSSDGVSIDVRRITEIDYNLNAVNWDIAANRPSGGYYIISAHTHSSVSGAFRAVDVIGKPQEILATPDLSNGWQGRWVPQIPISGTFAAKLTRKSLSSSAFQVITQDNGTTWTFNTNKSINNTTNTVTLSTLTGDVLIESYVAWANMTQEDVNSPVLNAYEGLGDVWAGFTNEVRFGNALIESLLSKVGTGSVSSTAESETYKLYSSLLLGSTNIIETNPNEAPTHAPINLLTPNNDSPAVKALWYQTANNQKASLNFAWNELVYNSGGAVGNEWGDTTAATTYKNATGTISITSGTGTYTNINGDTCLRGSAKLSKPLGYTKNQARAGEQTAGVDL